MRRFMQALARGAKAVQGDPALGVDALLKANPDLDRGLQLAQRQGHDAGVLPRRTRAFRGATRTPTQWKAYGQWMVDNNLVTRPADADGGDERVPAGRGTRSVTRAGGERSRGAAAGSRAPPSACAPARPAQPS